AVNKVFEPASGDVVQLVGGDDLHVGHEEGRIEAGIRDPSRNVATGDADLVEDGSVRRNDRVVRLAAQDIDNTARLVALLARVGEEGAGGGLDDPPAGGVLLQGLLEGAQEKVALGAVVEDDAKARVYLALIVREGLLHRGDECFLATE